MGDSAANWVSAMGTILALGAAIWAGITAKRLYNIERERDIDRDHALERSQADQFASWVSWSWEPQVAMDLPDGVRSPSLAFQNGAPVPVYQVAVKYFEGAQELGSQDFHVISPTGPTAHHREIKCPAMAAVLSRPRASGTRLDLRVAITFTDARGVQWTRDRSGRLEKVGVSAPARD